MPRPAAEYPLIIPLRVRVSAKLAHRLARVVTASRGWDRSAIIRRALNRGLASLEKDIAAGVVKKDS